MLDNPRVGFLDGLTPNQLQAANKDGPVLVLAGAGTRKTRTLTAAVARRIMVSGIDPSRVLAVTFTNKAAKEMSDHIQATLDMTTGLRWVGTFHGLGARQLRTEPEVASLRTGFDILDADDSRRIIKRCMKAMNLAGGGDEPCAAGKGALKAVVNAIDARFPAADNKAIIENPAFHLSDAGIRSTFARAYEGTRALYYRGQPPFGKIITKIRENAVKL